MKTSSTIDDHPWIKGSHKLQTTYGRTALWGALKILEVAGKEVALPAFTCKNTVVDAVLQAGANPVFIDVDPSTLNMNLGDLRRKISPRTKAVISHHYYGFTSTNLDEVQAICRPKGITHVEDGTHSLGAVFNHKLVGSWGDLSIYSFSKSMINPGGGCLTSNDNGLAALFPGLLKGQSLIDEAFKTFFTFTYYTQLRRDILSRRSNLAPVLNGLNFSLRVYRKIFGYSDARAIGLFYQMKERLPLKKMPEMRIAMTYFQKRFIFGGLKGFAEKVALKKAAFGQFEKIVVPAIDLRGMKPNYSNFLFKTRHKKTLLRKASEKGLRLRETWPAFQNYWPAQRTANIGKISESCLMFNLDQYLEGPRMDALREFLIENRN